jgi:hypothetical protein
MDVLPWVFSSGWASGINGYAVVVILGLLGRAGADDVPAGLQRTDVLVAAAIMLAIDLVADKIPYVDSVWDTIHTAIRPTIGAILGALLAGEAGSLAQATAAATGGLAALASHIVKAGLRAAVNTSPEPASNIAVSLAEDIGVASVVVISVFSPWVAAGIAAFLLAIGALIVMLVMHRILRYRRERRERRAATRKRAWSRIGPEPDDAGEG